MNTRCEIDSDFYRSRVTTRGDFVIRERSSSMVISLTLIVAASLVLSLAASLFLIPAVRTLSRHIGIVDRPDPERKLHGRETALCGGLGVFVAAIVPIFTLLLWARGEVLPAIDLMPKNWLVLLGAAASILMVGLIDDAVALRGRQKLLAQIVILSCLVGSGTIFEHFNLFGIEIPLGIFAYPVTMLWLLGAVNALNLIDGADGMATTAGIIICAGLAAIGVFIGDPMVALTATSLCGALVGFLVYNKPPASIFLGDAGSMLIGLIVGVLATWSSVKGSAVLAAAPVAVLAVPLFDSFIAILRRGLTGRSIYATDRAHLHHLLSARFGPNGMLVVVASLCGITTVAAVLSVVLGQQWIAIAGVVFVLGLLVITRSFGHAELSLLLRRLANFAEGMVTRSDKCEEKTVERQVQLQGNRQWSEVWDALVQFAGEYELARISLDLNISWMHEGYHGTFTAIRLPEKVERLRLQLPLVVFDSKLKKDRVIGKLDVIARADHPKIYDMLELLSRRVCDLRPQLTELLINEDTRFPNSPRSSSVPFDQQATESGSLANGEASSEDTFPSPIPG